MTCSEFQKLILPFVHGELGISEKEKFIEHLSLCPKCSEELEIYYIIINSIKELDDEEDLPDDFHKEYLKFIKNTEKDIKLYKRKSLRQRTAFSAVVGLSVLLTGVSFNPREDEIPEQSGKKIHFTESDMNMRFRFRDSHIFYDSGADNEMFRKWMEMRRLRIDEK